ncbi:winged helix-turn-helix domain-containing protein [Streptomyces sp. Qhu-G9]|uniref:GntR family transcriptional regulator n=1 Tax=Streptomyces sp. Qhu-G9 TaxID=3452799 RepID=UPI0022AC1683|nr:winged helix-turn-helix domain-containing protein [Streptomyces aurantiacus]WAU78793.1 winged helix-turn-helix domain-containing protein [Streptomyces aurantiacus]
MAFEIDRTRVVWRQVAAAVTARIVNGDYPARTRVPSIAELTAEFGIAAVTAQKVHKGLRAEGLIYTEPGLGSFVAERPVEPSSETKG